MLPVILLNEHHPLWANYVMHLEHVGMARWALRSGGQYHPEWHYLGVVNAARQVMGHLSLRVQAIDMPGVPNLTETFVNTFAVEPDYRRRGYGRALQTAALRLTGSLGCYQMRSWSSFDHPENYALKLSLGFGVHPAVMATASGETVSGVYFVKPAGN